MQLGVVPRPCPPKLLLVPPNENYGPPSKDCAPKKLTGLVLLECNSKPETPKVLVFTPELVSKNCFFLDFAIKIVCFSGFTQEFINIRVYFGGKPFCFCFLLWFSTQMSRKFADFWRRSEFVVKLSSF